MSEFLLPLLGGALLGLSATILMLGAGKVAGISGIIRGALIQASGDVVWRVAFIFSMVAGSALAIHLGDFKLPVEYQSSKLIIIVAGLLVGLGTSLGNGCTSGHGICGIGRLSPRSIVATMVFMVVAILTVWLGHFF